jgi:hypothetical protein
LTVLFWEGASVDGKRLLRVLRQLGRNGEGWLQKQGRGYLPYCRGLTAAEELLKMQSQSLQINSGLLRLSAYYSLLDNAFEATVNVLCREMKEGDW